MPKVSLRWGPFAAGGAAFLLCLAAAAAPVSPPYLHAPAGDRYARFDPGGTTILPDGRLLRPAGHSLPLAPWPNSLTLTADGQTAFIASEGVGQIITGWNTTTPQVVPVLPPTGGGRREASDGGAAFAPDGRTLYWSSGDSGEVYVVETASHTVTGRIRLNATVGGRAYADSDALDLKASADGRYVYCADVTNFRVAVIDTAQAAVVGSVDVGRYPYALAVAGRRVFVANIGLFEYRAVPPPTPGSEFDKRGLSFPPFAVPSQEAEEGTQFEGRRVPGLGRADTPEAFSVWGVDVTNPAAPRVVSRAKTGIPLGGVTEAGPAVGGSAPNFLAVRGDALYVCDGNNDMIERVSVASGKLVWRTRLRPSPLVARLRGVSPTGLAVSPDGTRLYVCELGLNAVGVLDTQTGRLRGQVPTAWYPYRVAVSPDGRTLGVICFRGFGNGPKGGAAVPKSVTRSPFLGMKGVLTALPVPTEAALAGMTAQVLANNGLVDRRADRPKMASPVVPTVPGHASAQIKYVVFITKENHTYDAIFDPLPGAESDPSLRRWGSHQTIAARSQPTLTEAAVMTNHNALAAQFTVSDNFYMQPEASGVGHRWLVGVQPNNFCQMTYTLGWDFRIGSTAPGRRASFGSNGSLAPEDYPEAGSMWEHLARHGKKFRNYGEGFEFAGVEEDENEGRTGAREVVNIPMSKVLYDNTSRDFPIFNMNIPDQYRAKWFRQEFSRMYLKPGQPMPSFVNLTYCNDHGAEPKPAKGYPYVASWMADNDLALGRTIEFLSHTPYWKHMAIFVTEDDAGGEDDHIDAQRSVQLIISPWARRRYVSHRHTTILSMHRTLYEILGLPPLNMFDALANDFSDCFTQTPDFRPYTAVGVDPRIFDPTKAIDPNDPDYKQARRERSIVRDSVAEEEEIRHAEQPARLP